jgi:hypothetical protein
MSPTDSSSTEEQVRREMTCIDKSLQRQFCICVVWVRGF